MASDPGAAAISALVSVAADSSPTVAAAAAEQLRLLLNPRRCSVLSHQPSASLLEKRITHLLAAAAGLVRRRRSNSLLPLQRAHLLAALAHVFGGSGDRGYDDSQERSDVQTLVGWLVVGFFFERGENPSQHSTALIYGDQDCESLQTSEATTSPDFVDNSATTLLMERSASAPSLQDQALAVHEDTRETSTEGAVDIQDESMDTSNTGDRDFFFTRAWKESQRRGGNPTVVPTESASRTLHQK